MDDDHLADDFSNDGCLDLAMLPTCENAGARSEQDSNLSVDVIKELVYHLPHLLNSACSINILDKNCDSSTAQNPPKEEVGNKKPKQILIPN